MARRKINPEDAAEAPSFEQALTDLETIVDAMENESLPLEELVAHYEKGSALLTHCESVLQSARGRIELITLRNQNEITMDFPQKVAKNPEVSAPSDISDDPEDDNDIRLF
jgi:exodeoxyribonuclease VII small subunit